MAKSEELSASNKRILKEYVVTSLLAKTPKLSKHTLIYNIKIIKFVPDNVSDDSDKLTNAGIAAFNTALSIWTRKGNYRNGEDISDVAKDNT